MPDNMAFIDTNILLGLLSANAEKADRAEKIAGCADLVFRGHAKWAFDRRPCVGQVGPLFWAYLTTSLLQILPKVDAIESPCVGQGLCFSNSLSGSVSGGMGTFLCFSDYAMFSSKSFSSSSSTMRWPLATDAPAVEEAMCSVVDISAALDQVHASPNSIYTLNAS